MTRFDTEDDLITRSFLFLVIHSVSDDTNNVGHITGPESCTNFCKHCNNGKLLVYDTRFVILYKYIVGIRNVVVIILSVISF